MTGSVVSTSEVESGLDPATTEIVTRVIREREPALAAGDVISLDTLFEQVEEDLKQLQDPDRYL